MEIKIDRPGEIGEYDDGMQQLLQIAYGTSARPQARLIHT